MTTEYDPFATTAQELWQLWDTGGTDEDPIPERITVELSDETFTGDLFSVEQKGDLVHIWLTVGVRISGDNEKEFDETHIAVSPSHAIEMHDQ